ncbi:MAG: amino acid ABC transporter substrate-binding protein [Alphaproteobacteria bacterium]
MRAVGSAFLMLIVFLAAEASAGTLDRVRDTGAIRLGYREDAPPFAYKNAIGEAAGYSVDLCRAVAADAKNALGLADIKIEYVPVTAQDRFDAVKGGRVDILCGATTATLSRRQLVDFSLATFIDGASVLYRAEGPDTFDGLAGKRIGVRAGTTTEEALRNTLTRLSIDAEVIAVSDHGDGVRRLEDGDLAAYFADRAILLFRLLASDAQEKLRLSDRYFTFEPYALALEKGDDEFQLLVDRTLSRLYRSGRIEQIFTSNFGQAANPSDLLKALYVINGLPE